MMIAFPIHLNINLVSGSYSSANAFEVTLSHGIKLPLFYLTMGSTFNFKVSLRFDGALMVMNI